MDQLLEREKYFRAGEVIEEYKPSLRSVWKFLWNKIRNGDPEESIAAAGILDKIIYGELHLDYIYATGHEDVLLSLSEFLQRRAERDEDPAAARKALALINQRIITLRNVDAGAPREIDHEPTK